MTLNAQAKAFRAARLAVEAGWEKSRKTDPRLASKGFWMRPLYSRNSHFFVDARSLCGEWTWSEKPPDTIDQDRCSVCLRKAVKL